MQYTTIKEYRISKLTLGTVALGLNYGISNDKEKPDTQGSMDILSAAREAGINTLDTASSYGNAEQLIGEFLERDEKKQDIHVVTKFRFSPENILNRERLRKEVFASVRTSLDRLKLDRIPICLFHMSSSLPTDRVIEMLPSILSDLKHEGLLNIAGVSVDHPGEMEWLLEQPLIEAVQVPANIFDLRLIKNGMLERLHEKGKIVFVRSIFLQGLFFLSPGQLKGNLVKASTYIHSLHHLALQAGMSISQLAFSYIRDIKGITSIIFGAVNTDQVRQNTGLLYGDPLTDEIRRSIAALFENVPEDVITPGLWSAR